MYIILQNLCKTPNNPNNFSIFNLNTICNYDKAIIPYLKSEIGSSFEKNNDQFKRIN